MPTFRLIHREAATGDRTSNLSHLGWRVWTQYQLSADDFGVCPADATKFQGDNRSLRKEPTRRVQAEIENLIAVGLVGSFLDGVERYLYQWDWQEWQKIEYPTATSLPPIPEQVFAKCSPKTQKLFAAKHPKRWQVFGPHARGRDASATADATANATANADAPTDTEATGPPLTPRGRPGMIQSPGPWGIKHAGHTEGLCGWKCMFPDQLAEFANGAGWSEDAVAEWARGVRANYQGAPTGKPYDFWNARWEERHGSSQTVRATSRAQLDPLAGVREAERRG